MKKTLLGPKYNHREVEKGKYQEWLAKDYFTSGDLSKKPYCIVIPPPNVTGVLHLGHAWDTTLQDIISRRKRMQGYDMLWLPGMDHAGIATQAKIDAKLKSQGISRYDIGRDAFLKVAWEWKEEYAAVIRSQWAALGLSLDYNKERFTLDEGLNKAVTKVFMDLYRDGLIYRGERIINWDVQSKTALSNIEVEYKEIEGAFYHFIYPFVNRKGGLEIATTRPETMFGDVALMVHPEDERYQQFIGEMVYIPGTKRAIPVISDAYVDREFGTGVVKVTPAHDPNDFEVGLRHNLTPVICMNEDGTMNEYAGKYQGMDRFVCREKVVKDLQNAGLCPKIEKVWHAVGHSERTNVIVEPRLSKQWFVKMKPLAEKVLAMQASGEGIIFVPERFNKTFTNWLENIQDWCISRQLWWGHRIPAWYKGDEVYVGLTPPSGEWVQDEDVLDTWFSSALWPFSTLGWPEDTFDLKRYYPTNVLVTGYDIIFFWVARMAFQARYFTGQKPFEYCYVHGLIRDEKGQKMSKSLGNGIDPFDLIEQYGCDALRYFLTTNSTPGQDLRYSEEKVGAAWNYINKIWNIARYIMINIGTDEVAEIDPSKFSAIDHWIMQRLNDVIKATDELYEAFEFGEVARIIYHFVWDDLASWYIELTKTVFAGWSGDIANTKAILKHLLVTVMKLLHPFMPFVTEEIYQTFNEGSIMVSAWPKPFVFETDTQAISFTGQMMDIISSVRSLRAEKNVPLSKPLTLYLEVANEELAHFLDQYQVYMQKLVNFNNLTIKAEIDKQDCLVIVLQEVKVIVPSKELVDLEKELARLTNEKERLTFEVNRSQKMLNNPSFVEKAPKEKVELERTKLMQYQKQLQEVEELLNQLLKG
ncbi:MAG: valine--tRNA ligase [Bacilli bacterium]|jgi:valyl-tRNA synthetase|nr:valine--tRNA ligase [Acholeplasmataceae bacterium]